ncbi:uncharacterized protein LOC132613828 isoform X1 [Lycium barbarum]|uniref:uncharacterized protein LOC132613828 isoform X1 n=1 Tax=Lycium barbarum TaxID=112863 RepID=UPI00293E7675|nr:uncharacterized protein LOC132613828 isoform X1 [Lycium barbarum]XP_060184076.1 uncharacterized protein LOC132613828 isoform X1 [Lycium barbarum]XP_060184077.1 uncharacterized protein LOC132613828 isoform X1 [Lycium barbarum]XP_060184078.1 uncharacterized protein LOC132613828 isoform X1 [Lycium barbarum]XP_060184079.1 uncharacterized protein LOC132613828 isoform X1 [Lycium barbarum]XP_060184080.1 uncharacterized protein LOC132613828 isoform X1 [Lycium barbarum]XP_060184081.1 uncharacterize
MTENLDEIINHLNGYKDSKPLVFPKKDLLDSSGYDGTKDSLACETKERNEFRNVQELDDLAFSEDISRSNKHEIRASPVKNDDLNEGLPNLTSCNRNGNPFACDTEDRGHPCSIPDFVDDEEKGAVVSNAQFTSLSELFDTDTYLYTDKGVVECKFPESAICYKESNYNIMKDICMDEGVPIMDKIVTESRKDDQPRNTADESKASSVESNFKISADSHTTEEDEGTKSLVPNGLNPFLDDNMSKDADKDSYREDVMEISGSKCTTTEKATNISEKESDNQNSKESNSDVDQSAKQPDQFLELQMHSSIIALNSQNAVSAADETNNNGPASNIFNNSKSEAGAVTRDFNLTELALSSSVAKVAKNLPEQSVKLEAVSSQKDGKSDSFSATSQVHFSNNVDSIDPQNVANHEDKNSGNLPLGGHGHFADGEASFSAAGPASGLITYSGPILHSGNVSLRSDSSTTSTRSFAFPVLQYEWNSSPVRMAKAERRKHRSWRQSLLCCKF